MKRCALLILLAAPAGHAEERAPVQMHLAFAAYAAGLNVINLQTGIEMTSLGYRVEVDFRTAGVFGAVVRAQTQSIAAGAWQGRGVAPTRYYSYGTVRGVARRTQIDFEAGQPIIKILEPGVDEARDPIPPGLTRNTVDTLSAVAELVHDVALSNQCDGRVSTFDGRRVSEIAVHRVGEVMLAKEEGSIYAGTALRCDFDGRQIAGFVHDVERAELQKPQHGSAWLAAVLPGMPAVPVRMTFHTRFFGDATMYLTAAAPGPIPAP